MKFAILDFRIAIAEKTGRKSIIEYHKSLHSDAIVREFHPTYPFTQFREKTAPETLSYLKDQVANYCLFIRQCQLGYSPTGLLPAFKVSWPGVLQIGPRDRKHFFTCAYPYMNASPERKVSKCPLNASGI